MVFRRNQKMIIATVPQSRTVIKLLMLRVDPLLGTNREIMKNTVAVAK
jgi:hypothetical protein